MDPLKPVKQLGKLALETITLRRLLLNRFVILAVLLVAVTGLVIPSYTATRSDGRIEGTVVDADGEPVEGATVSIQKLKLKSQRPYVSTNTSADGQFHFRGKTTYIEFRIYAEKEGVGRSAVKNVHLYFRGQNRGDIRLTLNGTAG